MARRAVGVKDMLPEQVAELMSFVCYSLDVAQALSEETGDPEIFEEAVSAVENLVEMFGGNAIVIHRMSHESSDQEQGLDLLDQLLRDRAAGRQGQSGPESGTEK